MSKGPILVAFIVLCFLGVAPTHAWGITEDEVVSQGFLPSLRSYCSDFTLGQVKSQSAVNHITSSDERKIYEHELVLARQLLKDLALFCRHYRKANLSAKEKVESVKLLQDVQPKVMGRGPVAVGNLEISCALSMLSSAIFFDLYAGADEIERSAILHGMDAKGNVGIKMVREALSADIFALSFSKNNAESGDEVVRLAFGGDAPSKAAIGRQRDTLNQLSETLQKNISKASFADQLTEPDPKWLAWDILWSFRLQALCHLSLRLPSSRMTQPELANQQFKKFRAAISNDLSELQQYAVNASYPASSTDTQKDAYILIEVQEHIADGGRRILEMLCHRLEGTK